MQQIKLGYNCHLYGQNLLVQPVICQQVIGKRLTTDKRHQLINNIYLDTS